MIAKVWLAQLWAENSLGVLARSRTLFEELGHLAARGDATTVLPLLPLAYRRPVKNHVDAYLRVWGSLRGLASAETAGEFLRMLQRRDPALNPYLYRLVLEHGVAYLYNSRLFLANPCPDRLWTVHRGSPTAITLAPAGPVARAWPEIAERLAGEREPQRLAEAAQNELVLLRVGRELYGNPKLAGLPGAEALLDRLRAAGIAVRPARLAREAAE